MTIERIGVVGLGSLGTWISHRLAGAGFHVTVTDLVRDRRDTLASAGFETATLPSDVAQDADLVVVSVHGDRAVDDVLFDHGGILETLREGCYLLDTSTMSPQFSREATERLAGFGLTRAEACLVSDPGRADISDSPMLFGGSSKDLAAVTEVIRSLASPVVHTGSVGTASRLKAVHQELVESGFETAAHELIRSLVRKPLNSARPERTTHSAYAASVPLASVAALA
jgi:3-hydroxyisobutyrate dehydrogenase-like beta-hydroxyacid dehydrogenase